MSRAQKFGELSLESKRWSIETVTDATYRVVKASSLNKSFF